MRLRLTRTEVERLRDTGLVEESVDFGAGAALTYRISAASVPSLHAGFSGRAITVQVPSESARQWAEADEVGLYAAQGALRISVEKDFRCLTRRPEEQEPDAYAHPGE